MATIRADGVALQSVEHPELPWWKRPWSTLRCWWASRFGFRRSTEEAWIVIEPSHLPGIQARYEQQVADVLNRAFEVPGQSRQDSTE